MRVVEFIENDPEADLSKEQIAKLLGVTVRTIYNWRYDQSRRLEPKKIGRPSYSLTLRRQASWRVGRELRKQGYPGWLPCGA